MNVVMLTGHLGRQLDSFDRLADDFILLGIFGLDLRRDFHVPSGAAGADLCVELFTADQLAVGNFLSSVTGDADDSIDNAQFINRRIEAGGGELEQLLARRGGRLSDLRPGALDGTAADSGALLDRCRSIALDHLDVGEGHVQFFCHDLSQSCDRARAHLDFAGVKSDETVRRDRQPRVERSRIDVASR